MTETHVWMHQVHTVKRRRLPCSFAFGVLMAFLCAGDYAFAADAGTGPGSVTSVVARFTRAQQDFDQETLRTLTVSMYREVSPKGTWYGRDAMLDFYAPSKRPADNPEMSISEIDVRRFGDVAIELATIKYALSGVPIALRATFVAKVDGKNWKIVSVQYTKESNQ